jgi:hypothetical protein
VRTCPELGGLTVSGGRLIIIDVSLIISGFINLYKQLLIIIISLSKRINQHPRVINHHTGGFFLSSFTKKKLSSNTGQLLKRLRYSLIFNIKKQEQSIFKNAFRWEYSQKHPSFRKHSRSCSRARPGAL